MTVRDFASRALEKGKEAARAYKAPLILTGLSALSYAAGAGAERLAGLPPGELLGEYGRLSPHFFLSLAGAETARRWAGEGWHDLPWYKKAGVLAAGAVLPLVAHEAYEGLGSTEAGYNLLKGIADGAPVIGDLPRQGFEHAGSLGDVVQPAGAALIAEGVKAAGKNVLKK
ncbi:MAG: hypothetical protein HYY37_03160 [Candidatus Aenigmarchaeota archaeon]|nr:hypothetical protein [Candidatus Aenigmarchaeota archaeon]